MNESKIDLRNMRSLADITILATIKAILEPQVELMPPQICVYTADKGLIRRIRAEMSGRVQIKGLLDLLKDEPNRRDDLARYLISPKNLGVFSARSRALRHGKSKYQLSFLTEQW